MRYICSLLAQVLVIFALSLSCFATSPPPETTLQKKVELATHVFTGVTKSIRVVEIQDGKIKEVVPMPDTIFPDQFVELEIEIKEILYPSGDTSVKTIKYCFGEGIFSVGNIRKDTLGKELIFLTKVHPELKVPYFLPSTSWYLAAALDIRPEIEALLKEKVGKEQEEKKEKKN